METQEPIIISKVVDTVADQLKQTSCNPEVIFGQKNHEPWSEIELTELETAMALDKCRREKYYENEAQIKYIAEKKRRDFFMGPWTAEQMLDFIFHRAVNDRTMRFSKNNGADGFPVFKLDADNVDVIQALCFYFTNDERFEHLAKNDGTPSGTPLGYKLKKGIMLAGPKGTGKTSIMRLFNRNKRNCYELFSCRDVAGKFSMHGDNGGYDAIAFLERILLPAKCESNFYNDKFGVCFEDMGTEEIGSHYSKTLNTIAYLIQARYDNNIPFHLTHITTNLPFNEIEGKYGERVADRIKEMSNVLMLDGVSRR